MSRKFVQKFWSWVGAPMEFDDADCEKSWTLILRDIQGGVCYDDETFIAFIKFVCITNKMSAEYLRKANDPCKTFQKHALRLKRIFEGVAVGRPSLKPKLVEICLYDPNCPEKECRRGLIWGFNDVSFCILGACKCFRIAKVTEAEADEIERVRKLPHKPKTTGVAQ